MDNIVDVIVLLFFVVSLLSGLFKKKPGTQKRPNYRKQPAEQEDYIKIPDLFGGGGEQSSPPSQSENYYSGELDNAYDRSETENEANLVEQPDEILKRLKYNPAEERKRSSTSNLIEKSSVKQYPSDVNVHLSTIKKKLKNKNSLKDFILISEILGKPKALRR